MNAPTPLMIEFFERRTHEHIARVRACLEIVAQSSPHSVELLARAQSHDASKFELEERVPYIWLTEYHRCRHSGEAFEYPVGMQEKVRGAIQHHVTSNRHHPEFHDTPDDMSEVDLIEMACDWTAMAQEFGQDNGSARGWAKSMFGTRLHLSTEKVAIVYQVIDMVDHEFGVQGCSTEGSKDG